MEDRAYTVSIETWGEDIESIKDDALFDLTEALAGLGALGVVTSAGGLAGGPGAIFTVECTVRDGDEALVVGEVTNRAVALFNDACLKVGLHHHGIARADLMDERYQELDLNQKPEVYAGVSEIAATLGVSRQRVSELRTRDDFPAPIAELAAGPVWTMSSLRRFSDTWDRKPGRPRKASA
jgi:hypothetical protein